MPLAEIYESNVAQVQADNIEHKIKRHRLKSSKLRNRKVESLKLHNNEVSLF
jgi:hypothetical protein